MLGIDLTNISRFKDPTKSLVKKILHPEEMINYQVSNQKALFLAAHWSIKEALYKADNNLWPFAKIKLEKKARQYFYPGYLISTTKEDNYYLAIVQKEQHAS